jgi:pimeloyl-ACP methyl ester carboxylesterase
MAPTEYSVLLHRGGTGDDAARTDAVPRGRLFSSLTSVRAVGDDLLGIGAAALRIPGILRQQKPRARLETSRSTDRRPVLLVHGYSGTDAVWDPLVLGLRSAGFGHLVRLSYNSFRAEVPELIAEIGDQVAAAIRHTGADGVHLVGHSLGGLLLYSAVQARSLPATTLVTIASPHAGISLARFAPSRCAGLMHRGSPRPLPLSRPGPAPRFVAFYSDGDRVVPPSTARLPDPVATNVLVPGCGHVTICRDPRLVAGVVSHLVRSEQPSVADAA